MTSLRLLALAGAIVGLAACNSMGDNSTSATSSGKAASATSSSSSSTPDKGSSTSAPSDQPKSAAPDTTNPH